jgi:predicted transcriptional regulator
MDDLIPVDHELTMSSKEIAKLTTSRPDVVKVTMERLQEKGVISFTSVVENPSKSTGGRPGTVYLVNQRDSYIVVAQINARFTAKLVDRWMELEGITKPKTVPVERAPALFKGFYGVAKLLGLDKNAAAISANQAVLATSGQNVLALMGQEHLESESQEHWLTPTQLGKEIGVSAITFNSLLVDKGFQLKVGDFWQPTEDGKPHSRLFDTGKKQGGGVPITQLKWSRSVLECVLEELK